MGHRDLCARRRMLGGVAGQPIREVVQARCDYARFVLVCGDRRWVRMARGLGLLVFNGLDGFGEGRSTPNISSSVIAVVVACCVVQNVIERVWSDLGDLSVCIGECFGVHGAFLS